MTNSGGAHTKPGDDSPPPAVSTFPRPWQPLTPRGAAAFARASLNRVCGFQVAVAALLAVSLIWFLHVAVFPVVRQGIQQLPEEGVIGMGELHLAPETPVVVSENEWLALRVDLEAPGDQALVRDLELRFGPNALRACTGLGCVTFIYPPDWVVPFNKLELAPWWDAWQSMMAATAAFGLFSSLLLVWWVLATLYAPLPRVLAYFSDRELTLDGAWRMAAASLLAGAVFMGLGILALGMGWIHLTKLLLFFLVHLVIPIVYIVVGTSVLPPRPRHSTGPNPFHPSSEEGIPEASATVTVSSPSIPVPAASPQTTVPEPHAPRSSNPFTPPVRDSLIPSKPQRSANPFQGRSG